MKKGLIVIVVLVLLVIWIGSVFVGHRNEMVRKRESIKGAWSQVDVVLQRRNDLIPNLVETVKGISEHEQSVIDSVTKARAQMAGAQSPAEKIAADGQLTSALSRLMVVVENYRNMQSQREFPALAGRTCGNGKPHRSGAPQVQRDRAKLQHLHRLFPKI